MKKEPYEKDYYDHVRDRNMTNLKLGAIVVAIAVIVGLLDKYFHFLSK